MRRVHPLLLLALVGCATHRLTVPGDLVGVPSTDDPTDRACWQAREIFDAGDPLTALADVEAILRSAPEHVDAHRLRQDILRNRGRMGRLLWEAEQRIARDPASPEAHYLLGRIAPDRDKLGMFEKAAALAPRSFWAWFGTAFALRSIDPERALDIYFGLFARSKSHPLAGIALSTALRSWDRHEEAESVLTALRNSPVVPGWADLALAETYAAMDRNDMAWRALVRGLEQRPFDATGRRLVRQMLSRGLSEARIAELTDLFWQNDRMRQFGDGNGAVVLAELFAAAGKPFAARSLLETEAGAGPREPTARRFWRSLLLRTGDVATFLRALRLGFPTALLDDERNLVRGTWVRLLRGPWNDLVDPLQDLGVATGLTDSLLRAGLLVDAEMVATQALMRHVAAPDETIAGLAELRDEARCEIAFENAMRRALYRGYDGTTTRTLDDLLAELRALSMEILGQDVVGEPDRFHIPLVGDLLDPFRPGLCAHLARYNQHLVLGQRLGHPVEGLLLVRLSVRELDPHPDLPLGVPAREVIGEDRRVRSLAGIYGGDLAGVALINHYVIDMDSVRDWALEVEARRHVVAADGGVALEDPLPDNLPSLRPASVHWRLSAVSPVEDADLEAAVLDMIRWHEYAHLVDVYHYLPVEGNLWRTIGMLLRHGFSRRSIEAEMEARAETAALALSPHTQLVLAHIAVFLDGEPNGSPHALGFRRVARRVVDSLRATGNPAAAVSRWHELDPPVVRQLAREMLQQLW